MKRVLVLLRPRQLPQDIVETDELIHVILAHSVAMVESQQRDFVFFNSHHNAIHQFGIFCSSNSY